MKLLGPFPDFGGVRDRCDGRHPQDHIALAVAAENDRCRPLGGGRCGLHFWRRGYVLNLADDFAALAADVLHNGCLPSASERKGL